MAEETTNESTCCSCLSTHILSDYSGSLDLDGIEHYILTVDAETTIDEDMIFIERTISCTHAELNEPIEVEIIADLYITDSDEEDYPLCGLSFDEGSFSFTSFMDQNHQVVYHFRFDHRVDSDFFVAQSTSFTFEASGEVTIVIKRQGESHEMDYPATAELKMTIAQSGGSTQAEIHPPSTSLESSKPNDERPAPIKVGKRKRSSSSSSSSLSKVDGGVRCTVCTGSLDAILEAGRSLHVVRCGHLMCSDCVPGGDEQALCRRCNQLAVGVRRLYGV